MQTKRNAVIMLAAVLVAALGWLGAEAQNATRAKPTAVAVVDLSKVFQNLKQFSQVRADLQSKQEEIKQKIRKMKKDIQAMQGDLDLLQPGTAAYQQKQQQREQAVIRLKVYGAFQGRKLQSEEKLQRDQLMRKVGDSISKIAGDVGYDVVLYKNQVLNLPGQDQQHHTKLNFKIVAWSADRLDVTNQIVQRMNNAYEAGQKP